MKRYLFIKNKMKFSIQEDGEEKQCFLSFQEAEKKTGISSLTIARILRSEKDYFRRRSDKKVIFIKRENDEPFIQIDGEDFHSYDEIYDRFGLKRQVFYKQLVKKGGNYILDSQGAIHGITKKSEILEKILDEAHTIKMMGMVIADKKRYKKMPVAYQLDKLVEEGLLTGKY